MEKIFEHANEQHIRAGILYLNSEDTILYFDEEFENAVTKEELANLFKKGIVVVNDGANFIRPTTLSVNTNYAVVSYATSGDADTAVIVEFHSEGYEG